MGQGQEAGRSELEFEGNRGEMSSSLRLVVAPTPGGSRPGVGPDLLPTAARRYPRLQRCFFLGAQRP
jgi:hypothetical protein